MKNMEMEMEGSILLIRVDMEKTFGPSKSGKTIIIASSEGNQPVLESTDKFIGLNIYQK
jgi:hypothetical protein